MSSISNLKPLVNARILVQNNNQLCTQYGFNPNTFTPVTVSTTQNGDPSGGSNGDYSINTGTGALWKNTSDTWGTVNGGYVLVSCPSNATYNGKVYSTNGSGVLSSVNNAVILTSTTKAYSTNGSGSATALNAGRYFNTTPNPEQVYNIALGVTDGTYTTLTFNNGQILTTNSACWCLVNSNWVSLS